MGIANWEFFSQASRVGSAGLKQYHNVNIYGNKMNEHTKMHQPLAFHVMHMCGHKEREL